MTTIFGAFVASALLATVYRYLWLWAGPHVLRPLPEVTALGWVLLYVYVFASTLFRMWLFPRQSERAGVRLLRGIGLPSRWFPDDEPDRGPGFE